MSTPGFSLSSAERLTSPALNPVVQGFSPGLPRQRASPKGLDYRAGQSLFCYNLPMNERESTMRQSLLVAIVLIAAAMLLTTCGGGHKRAVVQGLSPGSSVGDKTSPEGLPAEAGLDYQEAVSLDSALSELAALETPEGVDPALFAELKDALREALDQRFSPLTSNPSSLTPAKLVSTPPTGESNRVNDLTITDIGGGTYTLSWHYRNLGDYDQNGTVGISDITPIAMHYGETYDPETEPNCLLAVIDGSANGVVDIADITPIAMNYGVECAGYNIEGSYSPIGSFSFIQEAPLSEAMGDGRLEFFAELDELSWDYYRVRPYDSEGIAGIPSIVASVAPLIHSVSPLAGAQGSDVTFVANVTGVSPLTYAWDFGGGATPNVTNDSEPTVTLGAAGSYSASLIVANAYGSDNYDFMLNVELQPTIIEVMPTIGDPGQPATFTATVEGTLPFTYDWDFGGGATPNTSEQESPQVILAESGIYTISLTVTNVWAADTYSFSLTVTDWVHTWGGNSSDVGVALAVDQNGDAYLAGPGVLLLKYDTGGNLLWAKTWGGAVQSPLPLELLETSMSLDILRVLVLAGPTLFFSSTHQMATSSGRGLGVDPMTTKVMRSLLTTSAMCMSRDIVPSSLALTRTTSSYSSTILAANSSGRKRGMVATGISRTLSLLKTTEMCLSPGKLGRTLGPVMPFS